MGADLHDVPHFVRGVRAASVPCAAGNRKPLRHTSRAHKACPTWELGRTDLGLTHVGAEGDAVAGFHHERLVRHAVQMVLVVRAVWLAAGHVRAADEPSGAKIPAKVV